MEKQRFRALAKGSKKEGQVAHLNRDCWWGLNKKLIFEQRYEEVNEHPVEGFKVE